MQARGWRRALAMAWVSIPLAAAACGPGANLADPIPEIPRAQQRTIDRSELRWQWPFTVGTGTLGCVDGAIVFRSTGTSYALNDLARSRGFASNESIRQIGASGPPSNPLSRLTQADRERIFAESIACERSPANWSGPKGATAPPRCLARRRGGADADRDGRARAIVAPASAEAAAAGRSPQRRIEALRSHVVTESAGDLGKRRVVRSQETDGARREPTRTESGTDRLAQAREDVLIERWVLPPRRRGNEPSIGHRV